MSRLKHDKLSEMLAAANAAQQAAEQNSRRLEIKFARSDKGHALMRSAKLQASVADLESQLGQLQDDSHLKVSLARSCLHHIMQCPMHHLMHRFAAKDANFRSFCATTQCCSSRQHARKTARCFGCRQRFLASRQTRTMELHSALSPASLKPAVHLV